MGMKVHSESYLSELFLMRNYPEDNNASSWPLLYEDSFPKSGRCYNGNMQMPSMPSAGFGTETLRQTMLRQEHIFRKQVFELHRVYRVQRNLMNEIQKEGCKYQFQDLAVSPHMPSFASPIKLRQTSTITSSSGGLSTPPCANSQTLIYTNGDNKVKGSLDGDFNAKDFLSNELKRLPKRSFDLQLPAEEYVDVEDRAEISGDVSPEFKTKQLNINGGSSSNLTPEMKLVPRAQNKQLPCTQFVIDLNVPVQESEFTGMDDSVSAKSCKPTPSYRDTKEDQLSVSLGLPKDVFQGFSMYMDHQKKMKLAHLEDDGKRVKWLSHYTEPADDNNNASSLTSSWKKLETSSTNSHITAQTLPCFNNFYSASVRKDIKDRSETWNFSSSERLATRVGNDASSMYNPRHSTSFEHGGSRPQLYSTCGIKNSDSSSNVTSERVEGNVHKKFVKVADYTDTIPSKDLNLNFPLNNGLCNGSVDGNVTARSPQNGPTWLRKKTDYPPFERGVCSVNSVIISPPASSSSGTRLVDILRAKENDTSCPKKNIDFSDNSKDNFSHTNSLSRLSKQNINVGVNKSSSFNKLPHQLAWPDWKDQLFEDKMNLSSIKGIGFDLNLSTSATNCTEDVSSKSSMDVSDATMFNDSVKIKVPIDLESPAPEDVGTRVEERMMAEKSLNTCEHSEIRGIETTLVKSAAEAIVAMSTIFHEKVEGKKNKLEERSSSVCTSVLSWFTEIVCNNAIVDQGGNDQEKLKVKVYNQQWDEDSDYFEEMTLRLGEVDVSEYCKTSWKNKSTEEIGSASLPTRAQKGKSRRGRQRRDFQKDILPGIATLSWHEVTEDLQTIGGLLRASNSCWQIGVGRRKARNGLNSSTRGRRSRDCKAANASQPGLNEEVEPGGVCLKGWGKTTRRARRQRYPMVNGNSILT